VANGSGGNNIMTQARRYWSP